MKKLLLASVASVVFAISSMALVPVDDLPKKAAYFTSWGQDKQAGDAFIRQANNQDLFEEAGNRIDALYLSFLRWDGLGNIKDDDLMFYSNDPTWKSGAYEDIRKIYASVNNGSVPGTRPKFIATFGGWTYAGMWDVMLDDATRETLARNLVALMGNKLGPAYNGYKDIVGFNIDGIEFDFERQVRISPALNDAFVKLVERIREIQTDSTVLREIGVSRSDVENDMIMLTTYHVGADPVECGTNPNLGPADGCSFVYEERSSHHGEVVRLLKNIEDKNLFDAYNIMLYDAGRTEVFHPEIAIDNYIKYLPPERVNGGITVKEQWGPTGNFTRSEALNHSFIKLFKEKGLNGYFTWSIGGAEIDGVVNNSEEDINAHYRMAQVWENEIDAEAYEAEEFVASGTEFTVKTESILGQDHSVIQKDGKNYVMIGGTSYESGSDTVDKIPDPEGTDYIELSSLKTHTINEPGFRDRNFYVVDIDNAYGPHKSKWRSEKKYNIIIVPIYNVSTGEQDWLHLRGWRNKGKEMNTARDYRNKPRNFSLSFRPEDNQNLRKGRYVTRGGLKVKNYTWSDWRMAKEPVEIKTYNFRLSVYKK